MNEYVVDASVALKWFVAEELRQQAVSLLAASSKLHAPDLIFVETANSVWKKTVRGELPVSQARFIAQALPHYFSSIHAFDVIVPPAFAYAIELQHSVYDCVYLACAIRADSVLVTADTRFCRSVADTPYERQVRHLSEFAA